MSQAEPGGRPGWRPVASAAAEALTLLRSAVFQAALILTVMRPGQFRQLVPVHLIRLGDRHRAVGHRAQRGRPQPALEQRPLARDGTGPSWPSSSPLTDTASTPSRMIVREICRSGLGLLKLRRAAK
jgi:hypothetical protein